MVDLADSIYDLANRRCLESNKRSRATSEEIVKEFRTLYELSSNVWYFVYSKCSFIEVNGFKWVRGSIQRIK